MEHPCMSGGPCQCGGQCGCRSNALEAEWFKEASVTVTAADIRKVLSAILQPLQPHVKSWPRFLVGFSDYLYSWSVEEELEIVRYNVDLVEEIAWGKTTDTDWYSPPETEERSVDVPGSIEITGKVVIDFKRFLRLAPKLMRPYISDAKGFALGLADVLNNSSAANMIGKLLSDRLRFGLTRESDIYIEAFNEGEIADIISDEVMTSGVVVNESGKVDKIRVQKTWYKVTGRGIEVYAKLIAEVSDDWELAIDYDDGRYASPTR